MGSLQCLELHGGDTQHANGEHQQSNQCFQQRKTSLPRKRWNMHHGDLVTRPMDVIAITLSVAPVMFDPKVTLHPDEQPPIGLPKELKITENSSSRSVLPSRPLLTLTTSPSKITSYAQGESSTTSNVTSDRRLIASLRA